MSGRSGNPKLTFLLLMGGREQEQGIAYIAKVLRINEANITATAESLEVGISTLKRWIEKYPALKSAVLEMRRSA